MTPYQVIELALQRAKTRRKKRLLATTPPVSKCCKCDNPTTTNRFGKPIHICKQHYTEARQNKLCANCYEYPRMINQCYCSLCKNAKDKERRPSKRKTKNH